MWPARSLLRLIGDGVTWWPQAVTNTKMSANAADEARRSMVSSLLPFVVATLGAVLMALAFPKTNAVVLAPVGAIGLYWAWFGVSPKRAFWVGWLAGTVYFSMSYLW